MVILLFSWGTLINFFNKLRHMLNNNLTDRINFWCNKIISMLAVMLDKQQVLLLSIFPFIPVQVLFYLFVMDYYCYYYYYVLGKWKSLTILSLTEIVFIITGLVWYNYTLVKHVSGLRQERSSLRLSGYNSIWRFRLLKFVYFHHVRKMRYYHFCLQSVYFSYIRFHYCFSIMYVNSNYL